MKSSFSYLILDCSLKIKKDSNKIIETIKNSHLFLFKSLITRKLTSYKINSVNQSHSICTKQIYS